MWCLSIRRGRERKKERGERGVRGHNPTRSRGCYFQRCPLLTRQIRTIHVCRATHAPPVVSHPRRRYHSQQQRERTQERVSSPSHRQRESVTARANAPTTTQRAKR
jgi:hypothetical protein